MLSADGGAYFDTFAPERAWTPAYPVSYAAPYPERLSRWKTALRLVLVIPHLLVLALLQQITSLLAFVAWLSIVFSGHYDWTLWRLSVWVMRWYARVLAYVALLRDEYPPFGDGPYPAELIIPYAARRSRLTALFRAVLVLPQLVAVYALLYSAWGAGIVIAWFAILLTGRYPEGIWRLELGINRWLLRVLVYASLLVDDYPPFSLGLHEMPRPSAAPVGAAALQDEPDRGAELLPVWNNEPASPLRGETTEPAATAPAFALPGSTRPSEENAEEETPRFAAIPWWRPQATGDAEVETLTNDDSADELPRV